MKMEIGIETESCHLWFQNNKLDLFEFIDLAEKAGFNGIIINMVAKKNQKEGIGTLGQEDSVYLKELAACLREKSLFVELDTRGIEYERLAHVFGIANILGADIVRTFVMSGSDYNLYNTGGSFHKEIFERSANKILSLIPLLEQYGIKLAIENHELETSDEILGLLKQIDSPRVGAAFDIGNPMMAWEDPIEAAMKMAKVAVTTHIKDHIVCEDRENGEYLVCGVPLGEGNINLLEIFRILIGQSHLNRFNLEMCHPYATRFKRPFGTGGIWQAGEGSFALKKPPITFCHPLEYYNYSGEHLDKMMEIQLCDMLKSGQYLRGILEQLEEELNIVLK